MDGTTDDDQDQVLGDCVEDWRRRRALGERPVAEEYAERAGPRLAELRSLLDVEERMDALLDEARGAASTFPRPFGEYTVVRELGRGAMGVVYEAIHRPLGRAVALKVLRTGIDTDAVALDRFRREARVCAQVRHPHIVEVYDAGVLDGQSYYTMTLLRGCTLNELAERGELPAADALCRGFASIADALDALHRAGIVHRDVKPSNILIDEAGAMVLADFGLARAAQSARVTTTGQSLGTPLYMSPEQFLGRGDEIDGRADVYGLGAAMYEAFTGRRMFRFENLDSAMQSILEERPRAPCEVRPDLPEAIERIILKCIEKAREDRYPSAAALRDDLINHVEGRAVVGRPVSGARHRLRKLRRRAPALAAALVAIAGGAWGWTHRAGAISVSCWPSALVAIDGVDLGETPVEARLAPGRHRLTLRQAGFAPYSEDLDVAAGARRDLRQVLIAQGGNDPDALERIGRELGVAMSSIRRLTSERGSDEPAVRLLWPRGEVRDEDLVTWRVDVAPGFEGAGRIEFRRSGTMIGEEAFTPTRLVTEGLITPSMRLLLRPGDHVVWRFVPEHGEPVQAEFMITHKDLSDRLEAISVAVREQPAAVSLHLRARLLLDAGLSFGAYREAKLLTDVDPGDARAWLVQQHAIDRMGLRESAPWMDACAALAKFTTDAREAGEAGPPTR